MTTKRVYGFTIDHETRCKHYASKKDIVAIKFKCCQKYYPCYQCHEEVEKHPIIGWSKTDKNETAILCGVCKCELTIDEYLFAEHCPSCLSLFNQGCQNHYQIYFSKELIESKQNHN